MSSPLVTQTVRKDLAMAIRDLAQHGLMEVMAFLSSSVSYIYHSYVISRY